MLLAIFQVFEFFIASSLIISDISEILNFAGSRLEVATSGSMWGTAPQQRIIDLVSGGLQIYGYGRTLSGGVQDPKLLLLLFYIHFRSSEANCYYTKIRLMIF